MKIRIKQGAPSPLGATPDEKGTNFAVYSSQADSVTLGLFPPGKSDPKMEVALYQTESIWHAHVKGIPKNFTYAYKIGDTWVQDPYPRQIAPSPPFDWKGDQPLNLPFENSIIYEMHVRGFTQDPTSHVQHPGTFLGLIEKIPYLQKLGINAVELLPVFEFDETTGNYWGYSTSHFFAPLARYGTLHDFKKMVKALHKAGIEIILDVVYNHVGTDAFEILDKPSYFLLDNDQNHTNYTGCGNTVHCNHPQVIDLILASLRYWVLEMHVDGFRFDLASIFCRGANGEVLDNPPIIQAILDDPDLAQTKLIAEPWDCGGLYQVGSFPGQGRFAEWNAKFRDVTRRFLKGTDGQAGAFASVMVGSHDLYQGGAPFQSINFVTAHDGFTLYDLVSYNEKHNEENGEENRDGNDWNDSWNCGVEGPTDDPEILDLRQKQMRNFLLALTMSIGTPMFLMGDEYGHTRDGNNNPHCQDNRKNYFLWDLVEQHSFLQKLLTIRKKSKQLHRTTFPSGSDIIWHTPDWGDESRFIAYTLKGPNHDLFIAFNANFRSTLITLPKGKPWKRIVETSSDDLSEQILGRKHHLDPYTSLLAHN